MRFFVFAAFVLVLWFVLKQAGVVPGSREADLAAGKLHSEGFLQARVRFSAQGKTIEMVVVEEKPLLTDCQDKAQLESISGTCPEGVTCEVLQFHCSASLDARYQKLLAKQPTHLYYTHGAVRDAGPPRSMAMVVWGLTVDESRAFCNEMTQGSKLRSKQGLSLSCVASR